MDSVNNQERSQSKQSLVVIIVVIILIILGLWYWQKSPEIETTYEPISGEVTDQN